MIDRRTFLAGTGAVLLAAPLTAAAQQPRKLPTIGFLGPLTPSAMSEWTAAFVQRLRELGWIEGRTVAIEYRLRRAAASASPKSWPSSSG